MALTGTLDTLSLPELFSLLAATSKTGALQVRGGRGLGVVYFAGGVVTAGEAGEQSGPVADEAAVTGRLHDVCFELFRFEEGSFEFEADRQPGWPVLGSVKVDDLVAETARRLNEWREITTVVTSLEVRPRLALTPPQEQITLDRAQWRVITGIDGRRRVGALVRVLDGSEYEVCKLLKGLVENGLVELDAGTDAPANGNGNGTEAAVRADEPARDRRKPPAKTPDGPAPSVTLDTLSAALPAAPAPVPVAATAAPVSASAPLAAPARASAEPVGTSALEDAAREVARMEDERRRTMELNIDADGLNRGAVVAYLNNGRRK